jgi:hypothetical protein
MTEKNSENTKHSCPNGFISGMDEMMKDFCSKSEWTSNCCPQFMRMYRSSNDCDDRIMTMCKRMQGMFFYSDLKSEKR